MPFEKKTRRLKIAVILIGAIYLISGFIMIRGHFVAANPQPFRGWLYYWDGPYKGKVVDDETGSPIEGATIFGYWVVDIYSIIVFQEYPCYCDAKEAVTDKNGEFVLTRSFCFNPYPWAELISPRITIFKPGYDSYPPKLPIIDSYKATNKEREAAKKYFYEHIVDFNRRKNNLIRLKKVKNFEERKWIVKHISSEVDYGIEISKSKLLKNAKNMISIISEEEKFFGIKPTKIDHLKE